MAEMILFMTILLIFFKNTFGQCPNMKSLFHTKTDGYSLQKHVSIGVLADSETACRIKCYIVDNCMSYNYHQSTAYCEINDSDDIQHPKDLIKKDGYVYVGTENGCKTKPCPMNVTCKASVRISGHRCIDNEVKKPCNMSLGMEDRRIANDQIKASSEYRMCPNAADYCVASSARLHKLNSAWLTGGSPDQWLQVDLLKRTEVTSIATQGGRSYYVKQYKIAYSDNENHPFQMHNSVFDGNSDVDSVVTNAINPPIVARYIRIDIVAYHQHISMRIELYGCAAE